MSRWTHAICDECWEIETQQDDTLPVHPVRLTTPEQEECCFCSKQTLSGIYIRRDPSRTKCGGNHA